MLRLLSLPQEELLLPLQELLLLHPQVELLLLLHPQPKRPLLPEFPPELFPQPLQNKRNRIITLHIEISFSHSLV